MKKLLLLFCLLPSLLLAQNQLAGSLTLTNIGGAGFLHVVNQSSAPSTPSSAGRIYFDSVNDIAWKDSGGYVGKIDLGGASRTITLSGSPTLGDWFDQSVKQAASPVFNRLTSTVATGTAPFTVSSTTNVPNLNASSLSGATFAAPGPIGSGTPGSGAFTTVSATGQITSTVTTGTAPLVIASTTNVANLNASSLGGATFAAPGVIGGGTPAAGNFTTLVATGGIRGVAGSGAAAAGNIGEVITSTVAFNAVTLTSAISANITSVSLTAGDWDVFGSEFVATSGANATALGIGISVVSATLPGVADGEIFQNVNTNAASNVLGTVYKRVSISSPTTVYLVGYAVFAGTATVGGTITARRSANAQ